MSYRAATHRRIASYRQEDERVTPLMIDAGVAALRNIVDFLEEDIVRQIYEAMRSARPKYSATDIARFWQKVRIGKTDECWLWVGAKKKRSKKTNWSAPEYGKMIFHGKDIAAHIISYEIANGVVPTGLSVCHTCDNPPCVNPNHLWIGTIAHNNQDMWNKRRARPGHVPGSKNGIAVLQETDIPNIKRRIAAGETQTAIACDYGVTVQAINLIHRGKNWKHVQ